MRCAIVLLPLAIIIGAARAQPAPADQGNPAIPLLIHSHALSVVTELWGHCVDVEALIYGVIGNDPVELDARRAVEACQYIGDAASEEMKALPIDASKVRREYDQGMLNRARAAAADVHSRRPATSPAPGAPPPR